MTNVFDTNKRVLTVLRWILKALQPLIWGFPSVAERDIYPLNTYSTHYCTVVLLYDTCASATVLCTTVLYDTLNLYVLIILILEHQNVIINLEVMRSAAPRIGVEPCAGPKTIYPGTVR